MITSNTYYPNQWGLHNTGQNGGTPGIDVDAPDAWGITEGYDGIVIAVLDNGVDLDHPDLENNLLTGYDATDGSDGAVNGDCGGNYAHGTCCAGIIAAIDNTIGIKGVAPNCMIVPIRVGLTNSLYDPDIIEGLNYAWETADADIISCSWGGGSYNADIVDEIDYSSELGRDGLGCIVVFSTGNYNIDVTFPANCNPDIIAVGAINPWGERKSPSSSDGENWYRGYPYYDYLGGSNYSDELDIVAPGIFVPTTDIQGSAGYNTASGSAGNYFLSFNGTSAATPHVAGVAALVLSVNPNLTQDQVRNIIESHAQKVRIDIYTYSTHAGRTNGTWNNEMGYGLVDAYESIIASAGGPISGPSLVCSSGATFNISPPASFDSIRWNKGPYLNISSGQGTTSCTFTALSNGSSYVSVTLYANGNSITLPQKVVWAGIPVVGNIQGPDGLPAQCIHDYWISAQGYPSYEWAIPFRILCTPGLEWQILFGEYQTNATYFAGCAAGSIHVRVSNQCGYTIKWKYIDIGNQYDCEGGEKMMIDTTKNGTDAETTRDIVIYPNPASDNIQVSVVTTSSLSVVSDQSASNIYDVKIFNSNGVLLFSMNKTGNPFSVSISGLQNGNYILVVSDKKNTYQKQFFVNH